MLKKKLAVIGTGKIGETIISALIEAKIVKPHQIIAADIHKALLKKAHKKLNVKTTLDNKSACDNADIIILAVKPQSMSEVLNDIKGSIKKHHLIISVAASITTSYIEAALGKKVPVIRTMPNTPCLLRCGMTGIATGKYCKKGHLSIAQTIFSSIGKYIMLDEKYMDAVTGLSASGPAFIYIVIEALAEGGVKVGLPRDIATKLIAQTVLGSAKMVIETGGHPAMLKDMVTTPAGCTIDGILELEAGGLRVALIKAVMQATSRAGQLSMSNIK